MTKRGKVLVIDDEPTIVDLFTEYLTDQGFEVIGASSGIEGLMRLEADKADTVLLDMRMPEMDGIETLKRIRAEHPHVPVLMISANDDVAAAKTAIALGAFDYTLKPVDLDYLSRSVEKMVASAGSAAVEPGPVTATASAGASPHGTLYDLALAVFHATRATSPAARQLVAPAIEAVALTLVQRGSGADKAETVRALNQLRSLLRFAKDLGDLTDEVHRGLESHMARARNSVGLS